MINTTSEFLDRIDNKLYINNVDVQRDLLRFAFKKGDIDLFILLWLIQENHPVSYSKFLLESVIANNATVDKLLECLSLFRYPSTKFVEIVLKEGNSEQIEKLKIILQEVFK